MKHSTSDRGFRYMEPIPIEGGQVRVHESSNAMGPHLWLRIDTEAPYPTHVSVELALGQAEMLRDQLTWLIDNHYQRGNP